jgi:hypothetical protein
MFAELDEDGSGVLDSFEFKTILAELADADWVLAGDEQGRPYYINSRTRVSRWELPGDEGVNDWLASMLEKGSSGGGVTEQLPPTFSDETSDEVFDDADDAILSVDELFDVVDLDRRGHISFDEFEAFWQWRLRTIGDPADDGTLAQARSLFTDLDEDGSGWLDRVEFRVIMAEVAASDWTPRLDRASGRTFYVNHKTRAKRWTLPDDDEVDGFIAEHLNRRSSGGDGGDAGGGSGSSDPELGQHLQFEQGAQMVVAAQSIVVRKGHKKGSAHVVELRQVRTIRENAESQLAFATPVDRPNRTQSNENRRSPRLCLLTPMENADHVSLSE